MAFKNPAFAMKDSTNDIAENFKYTNPIDLDVSPSAGQGNPMDVSRCAPAPSLPPAEPGPAVGSAFALRFFASLFDSGPDRDNGTAM